MKFKPNRTYNFTTISPVDLGGVYETMKVVGILTYTEAAKYRDVVTLHEKMQRHLDYSILVSDLTFILFEDVTGKKLLLPIEYIVIDSIVEVTKIKILIEVPSANTEDIAIIQEALTGMGYYGCKITKQVQ